MNAINERLLELEGKGTPVVIGLIGAGQMGQEILCQAQLMKGVRIPIVVDVTFERAALAYGLAAVGPNRIVSTNALDQARQAIEAGQVVATTDWKLVTGLPCVQAVVDATGSPELGVAIALASINAKKHIVMMNVECDVTVGPILRRLADNAGVIYTLAAGDEPAAIMELYRFATALGFEVVAAGKGKNNPLDIYATPEQLDGIGEYCYRGSIDLASVARRENLLPLGLAKGGTLKRAVPKDHAIRYDDLAEVHDTLLLQMRKLQDRLCV